MGEWITDEQLQEWERLYARTVGGTWGRYGDPRLPESERGRASYLRDPHNIATWIGSDAHTEPIAVCMGYLMDSSATADWIIAAHNDIVPAHIAEVRRLRELIRRMAHELEDRQLSQPLWPEIYAALGLDWEAHVKELSRWIGKHSD